MMSPGSLKVDITFMDSCTVRLLRSMNRFRTMKHSKNAASATIALKQAPMHRVIYDALLAEIQQGQYRSGDRLPSELELCKRFQSSRITVAKAINSLQHEGLVVRRAGSGSYVQLAAPVTSYQFGLLIPELGIT